MSCSLVNVVLSLAMAATTAAALPPQMPRHWLWMHFNRSEGAAATTGGGSIALSEQAQQAADEETRWSAWLPSIRLPWARQDAAVARQGPTPPVQREHGRSAQAREEQADLCAAKSGGCDVDLEAGHRLSEQGQVGDALGPVYAVGRSYSWPALSILPSPVGVAVLLRH